MTYKWWDLEMKNDNEDSITKELRLEVSRYLAKNWIKDTHNTDYNRIYILLKEKADVMTITFTLQHIRIKILKKPDSWEFDCATASHLIEQFEDKIQKNGERIHKEHLELLKQIEKEIRSREYEFNQLKQYKYEMPKDGGTVRSPYYFDDYKYGGAFISPDRKDRNDSSGESKKYYEDKEDVMKYFYQELTRKKK